MGMKTAVCCKLLYILVVECFKKWIKGLFIRNKLLSSCQEGVSSRNEGKNVSVHMAHMSMRARMLHHCTLAHLVVFLLCFVSEINQLK